MKRKSSVTCIVWSGDLHLQWRSRAELDETDNPVHLKRTREEKCSDMTWIEKIKWNKITTKSGQRWWPYIFLKSLSMAKLHLTTTGNVRIKEDPATQRWPEIKRRFSSIRVKRNLGRIRHKIRKANCTLLFTRELKVQGQEKPFLLYKNVLHCLWFV